MARLVFRHYAHLTSTSCTSVRLRSSNRLSSTFNQNKHSSPSFGSDRRSPTESARTPPIPFGSRCARRLLGPCYKTGGTQYPYSVCIFIFHLTCFSHFNHSTSPLSVISLYLALGRTNHPHSGCNTKQPYSSQTNLAIPPSQQAYGYITLCVHLFPQTFGPPLSTQPPASQGYHTGCSAFTRSYSRNPR